ncbi:hypothetical protein NL676_024759 [Syzygium grande]|nr:hypothetical protein NL676_024759 [Syzygium grande]
MEDSEAFFEDWLARQEAFLDQLLLPVLRGEDEVGEEDAFLFFSAPWLTSSERVFLWIGGFKPTLLFRFLGSSVDGLTTA